MFLVLSREAYSDFTDPSEAGRVFSFASLECGRASAPHTASSSTVNGSRRRETITSLNPASLRR